MKGGQDFEVLSIRSRSVNSDEETNAEEVVGLLVVLNKLCECGWVLKFRSADFRAEWSLIEGCRMSSNPEAVEWSQLLQKSAVALGRSEESQDMARRTNPQHLPQITANYQKWGLAL